MFNGLPSFSCQIMLSSCYIQQAGTNRNKEHVTAIEPSGHWQVSPTFISKDRKMRGIEGKIGILGPPFVAGKIDKYLWHFGCEKNV
jgi:hypothetical protein